MKCEIFREKRDEMRKRERNSISNTEKEEVFMEIVDREKGTRKTKVENDAGKKNKNL